MKFVKILLLASILFSVFSPLAAEGAFERRRNPERDLRREAGTELTKEELSISEFVLVFYALKYGHSLDEETMQVAVQAMTDEEYQNAIRQAAKVAKSPGAQGLIKAGAIGEKLLKAIIVAAEEAAKGAGQWIEQKAQEYDRRNN